LPSMHPSLRKICTSAQHCPSVSRPARPRKPLATPAPGAEPRGRTGQGCASRGVRECARVNSFNLSLSLTHSLSLARSRSLSLSLALCFLSKGSREPFLSPPHAAALERLRESLSHTHLQNALAVLDDGRVLWHRCLPASPENRFQRNHLRTTNSHCSVVTWHDST
jgi:hypothetical protein